MKLVKSVLVLLFFCTLLVPLSPAYTDSTIIIDPFSGDQVVEVTGASTNPMSGSMADATVLGGRRDIFVERTLGSGVVHGESGYQYSVGRDTFSYSQNSGNEGYGQVVWDGDSDATTVDYTGLGGVDLTTGGNTQLYLSLVENDRQFDFIVTVWTDATNYSTFTQNVPFFQNDVNYAMPFSSFTVGGGSGADFTDVGAIQIELDGRGLSSLDVTIDFMVANNPSPTAVTMSDVSAASEMVLFRWQLVGVIVAVLALVTGTSMWFKKQKLSA